MTAISSAGRADTEAPGSPGAEKPICDARKPTPKQARFVEEYLIDLNATQAAIRAGYSVDNADKIGPRLVGESRVSAAIAEAQAKRSERIAISQDDVVRGLHGEATDKGEGSSHSARVSAWFHLGKHLNMFIDRRLVGTVNINDMNEAQLLALLGLEGVPEEEIEEEIAERLRGIVNAGAVAGGGNGSGRRTP